MSASMALLDPRSLYYDIPPPSRTKADNMPTLLYSWWCTLFAMAFILFRLAGRFIRNEMLFREDKIMALAMVFLLIRMAFVHVVLIWGTNNEVVPSSADSTLIYHREVGSRLVLAARVFYALYIWTAKFTVLEFLRRMTSRFWKRSYELALQCITYYLIASFIAVVIATITECHPITHYWQVVPDPGPHCREGLVQLITMAVADSTTDVLIVAFPVPVILASAMPIKRKIMLILLFSMSLILIVITANRVSAVIAYHGRQQYRTVWASSECLAAAITSNLVIIGSFLRDRGVKKNKFRFGSTTGSLERPPNGRQPTLTTQHWGSDEDLVADMGYRLEPELQSQVAEYRPAGAASPLDSTTSPRSRMYEPAMAISDGRDWQFPAEKEPSTSGSEEFELKKYRSSSTQESPTASPRSATSAKVRTGLSFADLGGLLDGAPPSQRSSTTLVASSHHGPVTSSGPQPAEVSAPDRRSSRTPPTELGGYFSSPRSKGSTSQWPLPDVEEHELSQDVRSSLSATQHASRSNSRPRSQLPAAVGARNVVGAGSGVSNDHIAQELDSSMSLQDAGGLLNASSPPTTPATTIAGRRQSLQDVGGLLSPSSDGITLATTLTATDGYFTPPSRASVAGSMASDMSEGQQTPTQHRQRTPPSNGSTEASSAGPSDDRASGLGKRGSSTRFHENL